VVIFLSTLQSNVSIFEMSRLIYSIYSRYKRQRNTIDVEKKRCLCGGKYEFCLLLHGIFALLFEKNCFLQ
jgi:hypothetical protein